MQTVHINYGSSGILLLNLKILLLNYWMKQKKELKKHPKHQKLNYLLLKLRKVLNFTNPKIMNKRVLSQTIIDGVKLVLFFQNLFLNKFFLPLMFLFYGTSCVMYAGSQLFGRNFPELRSWKRVLRPSGII